jgi:hypothetical protein
LAKTGSYTSALWTRVADSHGNVLFRLIPYSDPETCIAQITSLDLTLEPPLFENLIAEGGRRCG